MEPCYYCGKITRKGRASVHGHDTRTIDHKTPAHRGGPRDLDNCVVACRRCNQDKGGLTLEEYRLVLAYRRGLVKRTTLLWFYGEAKPLVNK